MFSGTFTGGIPLNTFMKIMLRGLVIVLPTLLTIAVICWLGITAESLLEIRLELEGNRGARPIEIDELTKVQEYETRRMAGRWESNSEVQRSVMEIVPFGLPDDYFG